MSSAFECVGDFHTQFGHPKPDSIQSNVFQENPQLVVFRLSLIDEEVRELHQACRDSNMTEVIDALADILYVVYGMGQALGINLDQAFKIVHESNMSKLCRNEQEAIDTLAHYKTLSDFSNLDIRYRLAQDGKHFVVYNAETGKILKNKYYIPADFSSM